MKLRYLVLGLSTVACVLLIWPMVFLGENGEIARRIGWFLFALSMFGLAYDNAFNRRGNE
jgi:hypothetical protein